MEHSEMVSNGEMIRGLHDAAGDTLAVAPVIRFRKLLDPDADSTYDYHKINSSLVGKQVRIEMYSLAYNPEKGYKMGCYKEVTGKVARISDCAGGNVLFIIFDDGKVLDPYPGTDIKIEVL